MRLETIPYTPKKVKMKLSLYLINVARRHEDVKGNGGRAPPSWSQSYMEVSDQLHELPALPPGKSPWYPLGRRLDGPQSQPGRCGLEKNLLPLPGIEPQASSPLHVAVLTGCRTRSTPNFHDNGEFRCSLTLTIFQVLTWHSFMWYACTSMSLRSYQKYPQNHRIAFFLILVGWD
jgi:hypothetical protein